MLSGYRKPLRTAVFISGTGSTLQSLLEMQYHLNLALVVSNKSKAPGILKARRFGVPVEIFTKELGFSGLQALLQTYKIERIILAGFMKIIPADFLQNWDGRVVNVHPSLLPLYPGAGSAEKCWGDKASMGVTIHKVITEVDAGERLLQQNALNFTDTVEFDEAEIFLRRTEQHLLRELVSRGLS